MNELESLTFYDQTFDVTGLRKKERNAFCLVEKSIVIFERCVLRDPLELSYRALG